MTMDVEKGAAASSSDEEEEGDHPEQVAICPPFAKGITSLEAGAHLKTLPYKVRRRVKALKKLQLEATNLEAKFYEEVFIWATIAQLYSM